MAKSMPAQYQLGVKQRTKVVEFARLHGIKPASRHFGLDRRTVRTWLRRWRAEGTSGLVPRYPKQRRRRLSPEVLELIRVARFEHEWGAPRTQVWLSKGNEGIKGIREFVGANVLTGHRRSIYVTTAVDYTQEAQDAANLATSIGSFETFELVNRRRFLEILRLVSPSTSPWRTFYNCPIGEHLSVRFQGEG